MKRAYWFLLLFGIWCLGCAIWYMFGVKGLPSGLENFTPHPRMVAILEILLMLMIACLIGYGIGWAIGEGPAKALRESVEDLEFKNKGLWQKHDESTQLLEECRQQKQQAQLSSRNELDIANQKLDAVGRELAGIQGELKKARENSADRFAVAALENEANTLRFRTKQLEFQNQELEQTAAKLRHEIDLAIALNARRPVEPLHPFVRPADEGEKDDLTVIKGIGPFIEKRLNMVGVYTLRQISEFTPQTIEQVTKAIEFFPNRMVRDDWVGQAKRLVS